ncbi:MAG: hypothetical protein Ct9H300mP16_19160 [Pseudomonadota bacterium]|nr:MAG: hypothetical protein Ct9H300mP16_19160 [Pseudomonadota bacterium]
MQKLFYLPEASNDFLVAVIGEELGLVGITVLSCSTACSVACFSDAIVSAGVVRYSGRVRYKASPYFWLYRWLSTSP